MDCQLTFGRREGMKRDLLRLLKIALFLPFIVIFVPTLTVCLILALLFWLCDCETLADYATVPPWWLYDMFNKLPSSTP